MVDFLGGVIQGRAEVFRFNIWKVGQDLLATQARCIELQHIPYAVRIPRMQGFPPHCSVLCVMRDEAMHSG